MLHQPASLSSIFCSSDSCLTSKMSRSTKIGSDSQAPAPWLLTILIASSIAVQHVVHGAVQVGFYDATCSAAESIVKGAVQSAVALDGTIAASIIRLHFHDCFAQGCDASIMLTGTGSERDAPPNLSVRGYGVINDAKAQLESSCPGVVSCADIIALAARDSVEIVSHHRSTESDTMNVRSCIHIHIPCSCRACSSFADGSSLPIHLRS